MSFKSLPSNCKICLIASAGLHTAGDLVWAKGDGERWATEINAVKLQCLEPRLEAFKASTRVCQTDPGCLKSSVGCFSKSALCKQLYDFFHLCSSYFCFFWCSKEIFVVLEVLKAPCRRFYDWVPEKQTFYILLVKHIILIWFYSQVTTSD